MATLAAGSPNQSAETSTLAVGRTTSLPNSAHGVTLPPALSPARRALQKAASAFTHQTALDRFVAETAHPWRVILPLGPVLGNGIKAAAWLLPLILLKKDYPLPAAVALCALVAAPEFAATKTALVTADVQEDKVAEHLVATLMFTTDNLWRTGVQYGIDTKSVIPWDWGAAGAMGLIAGLHGLAVHRQKRAEAQQLPVPVTTATAQPAQLTQAVVNTVAAVALAAVAIGLAFSGVVKRDGEILLGGEACALATLATVGKVGAWWLHHRQFIKNLGLNLVGQVATGWGTAAAAEYTSLIPAIAITYRNGASLPLLFGYMVALENIVRLAQFNMAGKRTQSSDYIAAGAIAGCAIGLGFAHVFA